MYMIHEVIISPDSNSKQKRIRFRPENATGKENFFNPPLLYIARSGLILGIRYAT